MRDSRPAHRPHRPLREKDRETAEVGRSLVRSLVQAGDLFQRGTRWAPQRVRNRTAKLGSIWLALDQTTADEIRAVQQQRESHRPVLTADDVAQMENKSEEANQSAPEAIRPFLGARIIHYSGKLCFRLQDQFETTMSQPVLVALNREGD